MDDHQKIIELKRKINHDDFRRQEMEIKEQNRRKKLEAQAPKQKKRKFNVINFIFSCFVIYFAYTAFNQYMTIHDLNRQIEEKETVKAEIENKAADLKQDVEKINDEEALMGLVEKIARDQYKMVRPNEIIYIDKNKNKFIGGIGLNENLSDSDNTDNKEEENNEKTNE